MYKITGIFRGKSWVYYRKTDKQAKLLIAKERHLGSVDIVMVRVNALEARQGAGR